MDGPKLVQMIVQSYITKDMAEKSEIYDKWLKYLLQLL